MGFFKDVRTLSKQGKALREQFPVREQLASASAQMSAMSAMLDQVNARHVGGERVLTAGVDTVAVVTGARQANALLNHNPMVELDLLVTMPGGVPVPVQRTEIVELVHLAKAQVGARLAVRVDPTDPSTLRIDWTTPAP